MNKDQQHIFLKKIEGSELSEAEMLLLNENKSEVEAFESLLIQWDVASQNTEISLPKANWKDVVDRSGREARKVFMRRIFAAAALIALTMGLNWFFTYRAHLKHDQLVLSGQAPKHFVHPATGAQIDMEAGSSLTLLGASELNFHGAAVFDVPKQTENALLIRSGDVLVRVIGTRFQISAPENSAEFVLELLEGVLEVTFKNHFQNLEQGSRLIINRSEGSLTTEKLPPSDVLEFRSQSLERICAGLQQQYGVNILIDPRIDSNRNLTLVVPQNDIQTALKVLAQVSGCKVLPRNDGTFALIP